MPVLTALFPEQIGWRVFFGIGIAPVFLIRRLVPESVGGRMRTARRHCAVLRELPTFAELFPTAIRASGQGFGLGGGRGFGSVVPATVGVLATALPLGTAMGGCALCACRVAFLAAAALPETGGADLYASASA